MSLLPDGRSTLTMKIKFITAGGTIDKVFRETDAAFNIGTAVAAVQCLPPGVYITMNGRVFLPEKTRKNTARNCFEAFP